MTKVNKKKREEKKARKLEQQNALMTQEERETIVQETLVQLLGLEDPAPHVKWADMESIKKLKVMMGLYAQHGKEFNTYLPLPKLDSRYLEVHLRAKKAPKSVVCIKSGYMPSNECS